MPRLPDGVIRRSRLRYFKKLIESQFTVSLRNLDRWESPIQKTCVMADRPIHLLLQALKGSLAAAIATCSGSQETQNLVVLSELRNVLLALLDTCADATQGIIMLTWIA